MTIFAPTMKFSLSTRIWEFGMGLTYSTMRTFLVFNILEVFRVIPTSTRTVTPVVFDFLTNSFPHVLQTPIPYWHLIEQYFDLLPLASNSFPHLEQPFFAICHSPYWGVWHIL